MTRVLYNIWSILKIEQNKIYGSGTKEKGTAQVVQFDVSLYQMLSCFLS